MPPTTDPSFPLFRTFLLTHVAETHPTAADVIGVWFTPNRKVNKSKEIAYQQQRFVEFSKESLATEPWIALITCTKHRQVESHYQISAAHFPDLTDKRFWDTLTADVGQLEAQATSLIDSDTLAEVDALLRYQRAADCIANAPGAMARVRAILAQLPALKSKLARTKALTFEACIIFIVLGVGLLILAIAVPGINELRAVQPQCILGSLVGAVTCFVVGGTGISKALAKEQLRLQIVQLEAELTNTYENTIVPCLRLAGADVAACRNDLDQTEKVVNYVVQYFDYLNRKLLGTFL